MKILIAAFVLAFFHGCLGGCAAERAAEGISSMAKATAMAIIEKSNFTSTDALASGRLNNPKYRVLAGMFNGVIIEIGLEGAELEGRLTGSGVGPDKPLSDETLAAIRARLTVSDWERFIAALRTAPASQPVIP